HDDQSVGYVRAQRLQRLGECIRLMRVINEDRRAISLADQLQPALGPLEPGERKEGGSGLAAGGDSEAGRDQRVLDLKRAGQRQTHGVVGSAVGQLDYLREAVDAPV